MNRTLLVRYLSLLFIFSLHLLSCNNEVTPEVTPETALESYLNNNDTSYAWEIYETDDLERVKLYNILLTSQKWHEYTWRHQLVILVPEELKYDGALLYISTGSNSDEMPNWRDKDNNSIQLMKYVAEKNQALTAVLFQVPNQPLFDDLTEDEIISLTFHNYRGDGDYTWPLLFPMVKSAVRSMDAIQDFSIQELNHEINRYTVSGASKRGWTTWLTGASDSRVEAIAPMVIDMLNMPKSISYHVEAWGDYSPQIHDYVDLGVAQDVDTPDGQELVAMVDPYSYRDKLTMPKFIFNGTNDEYWPVDVIKHYFYDLPGENYLHYVPNAGHSLGDKKQAINALSSFFAETLRGEKYPECTWQLKESDTGAIVTIDLSKELLAGVELWSSDSDDRDFRDNEFTVQTLKIEPADKISVTVEYPDSGFRAFYIDLLYPNPYGETYSKSTRVFVVDPNKVL
ncbi:MAG: PhoPQ-activated protein PqaA family protein [Fermentimonas sp.]|nr:PhoPQ-activated protein PqaA family protein [Fermentimonas sp.]